MNNPVLMVSMIFGACAVFSCAALFLCNKVVCVLRGSWKSVCALLLLALFLRLPMGTALFHGLEYEDCYVHQAAARQLGATSAALPFPLYYREAITSFGNVEDGGAYETFYHFIGYPTLIYWAEMLLGNVAIAGHAVSLLASCLGLVAIFMLASLISSRPQLRITASFIYAILPLCASFATTTSAEVTSSFFVVLYVLLIHVLVEMDNTPRAVTVASVAIAACVTCAVLIKRENILLIPAFPLLYLLIITAKQGLWASRVVPVLKRSFWILWFPSVFFVVYLRMLSVYGDEYSSISMSPFSLDNLTVMAPAFLMSIVSMRYYMCFGMLLLFAPVVWYRLPKARATILVSLCFVVMYSAHWRSYYILHSHTADAWDTFRYVLVILPLLSILSAAGLSIILEPTSRILASPSRGFVFAVLGVFIVLSTWLSSDIRNEVTEREQAYRIKPVTYTLDFIGKQNEQNPWVFTFQPCLFQIYGPPRLNTVNLALIDRADKASLQTVVSGNEAHICLYDNDLNAENRERYREQFRWLDQVTLMEEARCGPLKLFRIRAKQTSS